MEIHELIGKRITNVYGVIVYESYGLDTAECFVELNNNLIIDIPSRPEIEVWEKDLESTAVSIISDITDEMIIDGLNKINDMLNDPKPAKQTLLKRFSTLFFEPKTTSTVTESVAHVRPKPGYIKNRKIVDFIWYPHESYDSGFLQLDNGCIIGETKASMNGTGLVGLNYYDSIQTLLKRKGKDYFSMIGQ